MVLRLFPPFISTDKYVGKLKNEIYIFGHPFYASYFIIPVCVN